MPYFVIFILSAVSLLTFKLANLDLRLSDSNFYFYTGYLLSQGKLLYKDIFFTNLPLYPNISTLYFWLTGKSIQAFYFTAVLEATVTGAIIYLILKQKNK